MKTCLTLGHSVDGITLQSARRLNDEEKTHYNADWQDYIFISLGNRIYLSNLTWQDVKQWSTPYDGAFNGCENKVWIINQAEWDYYVALNASRTAEKEATSRSERLAMLQARKTAIEAQRAREGSLPTKDEAKARMAAYNNVYNEGGEGYVPMVYSQEDYDQVCAALTKENS